jgi:hypothetical protein
MKLLRRNKHHRDIRDQMLSEHIGFRPFSPKHRSAYGKHRTVLDKMAAHKQYENSDLDGDGTV